MNQEKPQDRNWQAPAARPMVRLNQVTKSYDGVTAVDGVSLDIYPRELFSILGGSGCGKTTLLRMLAGFETPTSGSIEIDGVDMTSVPPYERPVNMMFQSYALFPHMTVAQNVSYGLRKEGVAKDEIASRVADMLGKVRMGKLAKRKPHHLSGGERQRVALARALVKRPKLLLLDEPLAALDKKLREHTQFELMNLQDELGVTFVVVTHDQEEAMTLSTRIVVMNEGRFEQVGTPGEVYEYPRNRFVADFLGNVNILAARLAGVESGMAKLDCAETEGVLEASCDGQAPAPGTDCWVAVRPEKIFISKDAPPEPGRTVLRGVVEDLGYFGDLSVYRVRLFGGRKLEVSAQNRVRRSSKSLEWDDQVFLSWDVRSAILLQD